MFPKRNAASRRLAVVGLSDVGVEWLEYDKSGKAHYACVSVENPDSGDYVRAVEAARKEAGGEQTRVVLALSGALAKHRLLDLPKASKRELTHVLARKAAGLTHEPDGDPLFSCIEHEGGDDDDNSHWSLVAMGRVQASGIVYGLRKVGISVARIASEELAALDRAKDMGVEPGMGLICVAVGTNSTQVSLICEDNLYMVESLDGSLSETPQLVASLLQSVKTTAGFWRRVQRGSLVRTVAVLGLCPERSELLGSAIRIALSGARAISYPEKDDLPSLGVPEGLEGQVGRISSLEACLEKGPFSPKLTFPLIPRRRTSVAVMTGALVVGAATFGLVQGDSSAKTTAIRDEIAANNRVTDELRILESSRAHSIGTLRGVVGSLDRTSELLSAGVDYDSTMREVLGAFGARASILNLSVGRENEGVRDLAVKAVAEGDAVGVILNVGNLERKLNENPVIDDVRVDLPSRVESADGKVRLEFSVRTVLKEGS